MKTNTLLFLFMAFVFVALGLIAIFGPRDASECRKVCEPGSVLECGKVVRCWPLAPAGDVNPQTVDKEHREHLQNEH